MGYIEDNLVEGEKVICQTQCHRVIYMAPAVLCLLGCVSTFTSFDVGIMHLVNYITFFWAIGAFFRNSTSEFGITNQRVMAKVGFIHRRTLDLLLAKVESISVDQSLGGRMFGYGDLIVMGAGGTKEVFAGVDKALEFRKKVQEQASLVHKMSH